MEQVFQYLEQMEQMEQVFHFANRNRYKVAATRIFQVQIEQLFRDRTNWNKLEQTRTN